MAQLNLLVSILVCCFMINQFVICKKTIITTSMSPPHMTTSNQGVPRNRQELSQLNSIAQIESNPTIRASSFMVDPLIIIALIALPTIGMLGISSLIMPLIPIGIYLIQQFFPAGAGRRRRSAMPDHWEHQLHILAGNFYRMLDRFSAQYKA
ncbi:hypothetical protein TYRP_007937 [Tyrophagus putrescentiae]|nr:hypothetical protein TYRP_007937 [Tyrophagus putrescentiae]